MSRRGFCNDRDIHTKQINLSADEFMIGGVALSSRDSKKNGGHKKNADMSVRWKSSCSLWNYSMTEQLLPTPFHHSYDPLRSCSTRGFFSYKPPLALLLLHNPELTLIQRELLLRLNAMLWISHSLTF